MKNLLKISLLIMAVFVFCNAINAQGRASDKPFSTVLNEIKQHQAMRNKMLQQMHQTTQANNASQNNISIQAANTTTETTTAQPSVNAKEGISKQGTNEKPLNKPVIQPAKV